MEEDLEKYKKDCDLLELTDDELISEAKATIIDAMNRKSDGFRRPEKVALVAIENLIARNKDLEKQMGKDLDVVYLQGVYNERDRWKSKVREKKEFLERKKKKAIDNDGFINVADEAQIQLCEELLQEGDDK